MADATIRETEQVRFSAIPKDGGGTPRGIDGRVMLVCVDPTDTSVELPFPPGWGPGPDQPSQFEAVLLGPAPVAANEVGPTVKLVADADMSASRAMISSRTWQIDAATINATVLEGAMIVEARGT